MITDTINTKYGIITIPKIDLYIRNSLLCQNVWEKHLCEFFESTLKEGDVAIDIGAFVGTHTLVMSKAVGDSGIVYSFEPGPFYKLIELNAIQNNRQNIVVHHKGLSDKESVMYIPTMKEEKYEEYKNWGCVYLRSSIEDEVDSSHTDMDKVFVVPLDSLEIKENVKLIKIDTEGIELNVLYGAVNLIKRDKPMLVIEINHTPGSDGYKKVIAYLDEILDYTLLLNFISDDIYGKRGTCDYLFLPKVV